MDIYSILEKAITLKASDIHLIEGTYGRARVLNKFINITDEVLCGIDIKIMTKELLGDEKIAIVGKVGQLDFAYSLKNGQRFRINAYMQRGFYSLSIRVIKNEIPPFESLGLPSSIINFINKKKGLVLITGPTGCGKSTTLASLINIINNSKENHIITLEDPIEYIHEHKKSIISQREVGSDLQDFNEGLIAALRQDPDVILIGEMRDSTTISIALKAAETGHLVLSTLHTTGAAKTIDRIIDSFPNNQQDQIRYQLSTVCEGIVSQQLLTSIDGKSIVVATEVMVVTPAIRNLIRENKIYQIKNSIQTGIKQDMHSIDQDLIRLFKEGKISKKVVFNNCNDFEYVSKLIEL